MQRKGIFRDTNSLYLTWNEYASTKFIEFARKYAGKMVLDVGCSIGAYSYKLNALGFDCVGVDYNSEYVEKAIGKGVEAYKMDAYNLDFKDNRFDSVIMFEILEHLEDPLLALKEAKRVAKKNIILTVPNFDKFHELSTLKLTYSDVLEDDHRNFFTKNEIKVLFNNISENNIIMVNPAMVQITGYTLDELTKMKASDLFSVLSYKVKASSRASKLQNRIETMKQPYDSRIIREDGDERIIQIVDSLLPNASAEQYLLIHTVVRDVTKERQASENIRAYATRVIDVEERERQHIARELHDETVQSLASLGMDIDLLLKNERQLSRKAIECLVELRERTNDLLKGVRYMCRSLRPLVLEELGLCKALQWLASEVRDQSSIDVQFEVLGSSRVLSPEKDLTLFRISQEAINNVMRHAQATMVRVKLEFGLEHVKLVICDNGQGFELPEPNTDFANSQRMGLMGMRERARLLGGSLVVLSRLGEGTTVTLELAT